MTLLVSLNLFKGRVAQCVSLIANAHATGAGGVHLFSDLDRHQITVAAFLNFFIAWEGFLEDSLTKLMAGDPTISGRLPVRYVIPPTQDAAKLLVKANNKYFDYANLGFVRNLVKMFFDGGYPFEPQLASISRELEDLKIMRNASAHITSTTQLALEGLAQRMFNTPRPGIDLYTMLMAAPAAHAASTVFSDLQAKLIVTAELIAQG